VRLMPCGKRHCSQLWHVRALMEPLDTGLMKPSPRTVHDQQLVEAVEVDPNVSGLMCVCVCVCVWVFVIAEYVVCVSAQPARLSHPTPCPCSKLSIVPKTGMASASFAGS
jgi:hypothetical protein